LPRSSLESGVVALGTRLVVLGGFAEGLQIATDVHALDTLVDEPAWVALPPAPIALTHPNLAAVAGSLYLLGGLDGTAFTPRGDTYVLSITGAQWEPKAPLPAGAERGSAAIIVTAPHVYLIGGATATGTLATVLDYDLANDTWSTLPELPVARSHAAAMRDVDGTLIVAGGLASLDASQPLADVWALPLGATQWEARAPMPTPRGGCAHGVIRGHLICAGGEAGAAALKIVEEYDPRLDAWTTRDELPVARAGTQGAVIGQRLYIPGGSGSLRFEPTSTVFLSATPE